MGLVPFAELIDDYEAVRLLLRRQIDQLRMLVHHADDNRDCCCSVRTAYWAAVNHRRFSQ
jgi:hypothetical protein